MTSNSESLFVHGAFKAEMNTTPLVDVMLVLLIIFMISAPLMADKVKIKIPQGGEFLAVDQNEPVRLRIHAANGINQLYLDDQITDLQGFMIAFRAEGTKDPQHQSAFKLEADDAVSYQLLAEVLAGAKRSGVEKIGFADLFKPAAI